MDRLSYYGYLILYVSVLFAGDPIIIDGQFEDPEVQIGISVEIIDADGLRYHGTSVVQVTACRDMHVIPHMSVKCVFHDSRIRMEGSLAWRIPRHISLSHHNLTDKESISQTIEIGGDREVAWNEIVTSIAKATGRKVIMTPAPFSIIANVAGMFDGFSWFPAGKDQLNDLIKGSVCDSESLFKKYKVEPIPFAIENLKYLGN